MLFTSFQFDVEYVLNSYIFIREYMKRKENILNSTSGQSGQLLNLHDFKKMEILPSNSIFLYGTTRKKFYMNVTLFCLQHETN